MTEILVKIDIEPLEEGGFLATSKDIQGLVVQSETMAETIDFAQDAVKKLIESCLAHGDPLPPAVRRALRAQRKRGSQVQIPVAVDTVESLK